MSSHREAPEISKDPVADSTDLYAFMSPDQAGTVTLIANYIPLEEPGGGPNFYEFDDDVLYEIHIDNNGDAETCPPRQPSYRSRQAAKILLRVSPGSIRPQIRVFSLSSSTLAKPSRASAKSRISFSKCCAWSRG